VLAAMHWEAVKLSNSV